MDKKAIEIRGLKKSFSGDKRILPVIRGLDFDFRVGGFESIMGPSGSGKSTLLNLMAGLLSPDEGSIVVGGFDISRYGDREMTLFRRRKIGLIFQDFNLIPTLTLEENIALPLLLDKREHEFKEKTDELISYFGLNERRDHFPSELSGGEKQRTAIARALVAGPELVLADEPTGNLDSPQAHALCEMLKDLNQRFGFSILIVSHDPIVAAFTKRVHILKDGAIVDSFATEGTAATVTERYLNAMK